MARRLTLEYLLGARVPTIRYSAQNDTGEKAEI